VATGARHLADRREAVMSDYEVGGTDYAALLAMPTLTSVHGEALKLEIREPGEVTAYRVWVQEMTDADRAEYAEHTGMQISPVDVERYDGSAWVKGYQADLDRALELAHQTGEYGPI
jgi:hypothetical protein